MARLDREVNLSLDEEKIKLKKFIRSFSLELTIEMPSRYFTNICVTAEIKIHTVGFLSICIEEIIDDHPDHVARRSADQSNR